ncbi:hypothetical protein SAMN06269185_0511 [Natronoarchaeum philippinense]|uniref:Uncharacterized protein n=1 Tax=Natronoarchaeum philippinense TaxID=558529 RepID=A0A285N4N5_NATPI|nr:hypothetical protein [Natronoarchaeum philippinense]SNZ04288.1 hypothetical protein SAMN06269185_0511 [Natronoarchaeum philippinense]
MATNHTGCTKAVVRTLRSTEFVGQGHYTLDETIKSALRSESSAVYDITETPQQNAYDLVINGDVAISIFSQFTGTEVALVRRNYRDETIAHSINIAHDIPERHQDRWRVAQAKYGGSDVQGDRCTFLVISGEHPSPDSLVFASSVHDEYKNMLLWLLLFGLALFGAFWAWYLISVGAPSIPAPYW